MVEKEVREKLIKFIKIYKTEVKKNSLLIKHNIYFVAIPVAVVNPMNWGRLRLRRRRAEGMAEGAPPRRK